MWQFLNLIRWIYYLLINLHLLSSTNIASIFPTVSHSDMGYHYFRVKWCFKLYYSPVSCLQASLVGQLVKNLPEVQETQVWSLGWEDHLEKEMATHSTILAWKISETEEPGGLQSMGSQRVRHDWATNTHFMSTFILFMSACFSIPTLFILLFNLLSYMDSF